MSHFWGGVSYRLLPPFTLGGGRRDGKGPSGPARNPPEPPGAESQAGDPASAWPAGGTFSPGSGPQALRGARGRNNSARWRAGAGRSAGRRPRPAPRAPTLARTLARTLAPTRRPPRHYPREPPPPPRPPWTSACTPRRPPWARGPGPSRPAWRPWTITTAAR